MHPLIIEYHGRAVKLKTFYADYRYTQILRTATAGELFLSGHHHSSARGRCNIDPDLLIAGNDDAPDLLRMSILKPDPQMYAFRKI